MDFLRYKIFIIIALLSAAVYANSIPNGFVYDDDIYVVENPHIRDIKNIPASFVHPEYLTSLGHKSHYRPLVMISYTINYWISGLNPVVFRLTNLLFHIGTSFMLFLTVEAMLGQGGEFRSKKLEVRSKSKSNFLPLTSNFYIAFASALIFALHPFNSESVNYITARSSLMSGFFYLTGFYCWVRYRLLLTSHVSRLTSYFYLASLLAFLLGVLSKEVVVTLPLALLLYDIYFKKGFLLSWRTYLPYLPFILLFAVALVVRSVYEGGGIIPFFRRDIASQIFTGMPVLTGYLKLLLLPTGLNIAHDVEIYNTPFTFSVITSAIILFFYVVTAVYINRRKEGGWRLLSYFMIWYFVTLLIVIIVPLNRIMQENRCYISGAVFAMFLGVVIGKMVYSRQRYKFAYGILAVLMIIYGVGTVYRNTVWKNNVTLWTDAMEKSPYELLVYNNLSVAYKNVGEYEKAKEVLFRGIRLFPNEWLYHYNLAVLFNISGEMDYALLEYDRAIMLNPKALSAYVGKGSIYLQKEDIGKGMAIFQEVINRRPEHALAHYYMARAFHKLGQREDAEEELELAIHYAGKANDWKLIKRVTRHKDEGFIEQEIAPGDLIVNQ